jgi:hypothetical protein
MPGPEQSASATVTAELARLRDSAAHSAAHSGNEPERVIAALQRAALLLSDMQAPVALTLRRELHAETGLSAPMIEWGLLTSLTSLRHAPLRELHANLPTDRAREVIGVVLSGNVFVAALRALCLPLLVGAHVIAKTASGDGAFARALQAALHAADPEVGARLSVLAFSRQDTAAIQALCQGVDALSVYGDDETVAQLRQRLPKQARLIAHGHGVSAAFVTKQQLPTREQASRVAERVALDISAYDQHGCLSPQLVCVESGAAISPQSFAQLLAAEAMPALAKLLPPAEPTLEERGARMQWEAAAAVRGELYAQPSHAISFEPAPARPSPGGRLVSVYAVRDHAELRDVLSPFAEHLKCVGVAGNKAERAAVAYLLGKFCQASVCMSGEMQTPAFEAWADGAPPLAGLSRAR